MHSRFIHNETSPSILFLLPLSNIPLHGYSVFCLSFGPQNSSASLLVPKLQSRFPLSLSPSPLSFTLPFSPFTSYSPSLSLSFPLLPSLPLSSPLSLSLFIPLPPSLPLSVPLPAPLWLSSLWRWLSGQQWGGLQRSVLRLMRIPLSRPLWEGSR